MKILYFFTYDYSLKTWENSGTLQRELSIYKDLISNHGYEVTLVTYGDSSDLKYLDSLSEFKVLPLYTIFKKYNNNYLRFLKTIFMPFFLKQHLEDIDLIKQNQLNGVWIPLLLKKLIKKPLYLRTGFDTYLFSIEDKKSFLKKYFFKQLTKYALKNADLYTVTSHNDLSFLKNNFKTINARLKRTQNWSLVEDIDVLNKRIDDRLFCVGRLVEQKNYLFLFEQVLELNLGIGIDIVGSGPMKKTLQDFAKKHSLDVQFLGNLTHEKLQKKYKDYKYYVLPSLYEGNPKTLIEAMANGCVAVASNINNNQELIENGKNGHLFDLLGNDLSLKLKQILENSDSQLIIQKEAIRKIKNTYSYEKVKEVIIEDFESLC